MTEESGSLLRAIPAVENLLRHPELDPIRNRIGRDALVRLVRRVLADVRLAVLSGSRPEVGPETLARQVVRSAVVLLDAGLVPVYNATGVILHTNLGRAPLSRRALEAVTAVASGYSNLEYDLSRGTRGSRMSHVEDLLTFLTGAEAALVVNNNAAAVLLALNSLAEGRDVLVSRGELVEIGGSFRIPDVMSKSGARLREVGTTNKTHLKDYRKSIGPDAALLLKVHASNYRIEGFTAEVGLTELSDLGRQHGLPVMVDLGSGALVDVSRFGVEREPLVSECLEQGADLVAFSGDKILGGPQAGIVVGRSESIRRLRENPLARALRIDKLSLAALTATLVEFLNPETVAASVPTLAMMSGDVGSLERRATDLAARIQSAAPGQFSAIVEAAETAVGGGALPLSGLSTRVVAVKPKDVSVDKLERELRRIPPVIARIQNDRILFDLRTLSPEGEERVPELVARAFASAAGGN